jgi:hypothetical protein
MIAALLRTLFLCVFVLCTLNVGSYVLDLEQRVTNLEDKYENSLVLPRPLPFDIDRFVPKRGDLSK